MLGPLAALASSFTWAIGSAAYSPLSKKYSGLTVNLARASAAVPILALLICFSGRWTDFSVISLREILWLMLSVFSSYGTGDVLFLFSSQSLGVPGALAIASSYPIWSAMAGAAFLGQPLSLSGVLALLTIVAGVVLVILSDMRKFGKSSDRKVRFLGVAAAVVTSLFWSLNTYANAKVRPEVASEVANLVRMSTAVVICPLFIGLTRRRGQRFFSVDRSDWKKFGWIFCFEGAFGSLFFVYGLTHSSLAVASVLSSLSPAMAVPVAIAMQREKLSLAKSAGVLMAVAGVIWLVSVRS